MTEELMVHDEVIFWRIVVASKNPDISRWRQDSKEKLDQVLEASSSSRLLVLQVSFVYSGISLGQIMTLVHFMGDIKSLHIIRDMRSV